MTLVRFRNRRRPFGSLMPSSFFNSEDFFDMPMWPARTEQPALNIKETDDEFQIELAAPGYSKKDFNVTIENGLLNISAEKSREETGEEENYTCREFSYDSFERSLQLPEGIEQEKVKAEYKDGILKFKLAKKEEAKKRKPKMIEVS